MKLKIPARGALQAVRTVKDLLTVGTSDLPTGGCLHLLDQSSFRLLAITAESDGIEITGSGYLGYSNGPLSIKSQRVTIKNQQIEQLFSGVGYAGIVCKFEGVRGFRITIENDALRLKPVSRLQISAPILRRMTLPDIDVITIRSDGTGVIEINSMIKFELELLDEV